MLEMREQSLSQVADDISKVEIKLPLFIQIKGIWTNYN